MSDVAIVRSVEDVPKIAIMKDEQFVILTWEEAISTGGQLMRMGREAWKEQRQREKERKRNGTVHG